MPVTQLTQLNFKSATNTQNFTRRGSTLKLVDAALAEYEAYTGTDSMEKAAYLYMIIKSCDRYAKKSLGTAKKYTGVSSKSSDAIQRLRTDGVKALRALALAQMVIDAPQAGLGLQRFDQRKALGARGATTQLHAHYKPERSHYLANKVASNKNWLDTKRVQFGSNSPLAGSSVWGKANSYIEMGRVDVQRLQKDEQKLALKIRQLDALPDDVAIYQLLGANAGNWKVSYLNKIQRMKYLIVPEADGLFHDIQGRLIDPPAKLMYAMDRFGGLFAAPTINNDMLENILAETGEKGEYFNHSSFNGGREVLCAGILVIRRGELLYIDNNSGHYAPSADQLRECLRCLEADGVNLANVGVTTYESRKGFTPITELSAPAFLAGREEQWSPIHSLRAWGGGFIKRVKVT